MDRTATAEIMTGVTAEVTEEVREDVTAEVTVQVAAPAPTYWTGVALVARGDPARARRPSSLVHAGPRRRRTGFADLIIG